MNNAISDGVVLGGMAAWMAAAYLAKAPQGRARITMVETDGSCYCVFAGVGVTPEHPLPLLLYRLMSRRRAQSAFAGGARRRARAVAG